MINSNVVAIVVIVGVISVEIARFCDVFMIIVFKPLLYTQSS